MLQIDTSNSIIINGRDTGLKLTQRREGSVVYAPERPGQAYRAYAMPYARYSAAHDAPHKPGESYNPQKTAGRAQLETDVRALMARLAQSRETGGVLCLLQGPKDGGRNTPRHRREGLGGWPMVATDNLRDRKDHLRAVFFLLYH
jgi:hypothetical protein